MQLSWLNDDYRIFLQYDTLRQGFIEKRDLRRLIDENKALDLPKGLVKIIANLNESELDGQIDYDDFVHMSEVPTRRTSVRDWAISYCESIAAPRNDFETDCADSRYSLETNFSKKCKSE